MTYFRSVFWVHVVVTLSSLGFASQSFAQGGFAAMESVAQGYLSSTVPAWAPNNPVNVMAYQEMGQLVNSFRAPPPASPVATQLPTPRAPSSATTSPVRKGVVETSSLKAKVAPPQRTLMTPGDSQMGSGNSTSLTRFQERFLINQDAQVRLQVAQTDLQKAQVELQTASLEVQTASLGTQKKQLGEQKTLNVLTGLNVGLNGVGVATTLFSRIPVADMINKTNTIVGGWFRSKFNPSSQGFPPLAGQ